MASCLPRASSSGATVMARLSRMASSDRANENEQPARTTLLDLPDPFLAQLVREYVDARGRMALFRACVPLARLVVAHAPARRIRSSLDALCVSPSAAAAGKKKKKRTSLSAASSASTSTPTSSSSLASPFKQLLIRTSSSVARSSGAASPSSARTSRRQPQQPVGAPGPDGVAAKGWRGLLCGLAPGAAAPNGEEAGAASPAGVLSPALTSTSSLTSEGSGGAQGRGGKGREQRDEGVHLSPNLAGLLRRLEAEEMTLLVRCGSLPPPPAAPLRPFIASLELVDLTIHPEALAALQLHAPGAWPALRALTFRSCVFLEPGRPSSSSTTSTPRAHHHNHHHPAGGAANGPAAAAAAAAAAFLGGHHNNNGAANGGRGALALFGAADRERRQAALLQAVKVQLQPVPQLERLHLSALDVSDWVLDLLLCLAGGQRMHELEVGAEERTVVEALRRLRHLKRVRLLRSAGDSLVRALLLHPSVQHVELDELAPLAQDWSDLEAALAEGGGAPAPASPPPAGEDRSVLETAWRKQQNSCRWVSLSLSSARLSDVPRLPLAGLQRLVVRDGLTLDMRNPDLTWRGVRLLQQHQDRVVIAPSRSSAASVWRLQRGAAFFTLSHRGGLRDSSSPGGAGGGVNGDGSTGRSVTSRQLEACLPEVLRLVLRPGGPGLLPAYSDGPDTLRQVAPPLNVLMLSLSHSCLTPGLMARLAEGLAAAPDVKTVCLYVYHAFDSQDGGRGDGTLLLGSPQPSVPLIPPPGGASAGANRSSVDGGHPAPASGPAQLWASLLCSLPPSVLHLQLFGCSDRALRALVRGAAAAPPLARALRLTVIVDDYAPGLGAEWVEAKGLCARREPPLWLEIVRWG